MKKQKLNSKLNLKKITISKLDADQYQHIVGGGDTMFCASTLCETQRGIKCIQNTDQCPGSDNLCNGVSKVGGICR